MNPDLLHQILTPSDHPHRFYGVVIGVVTSNKDPENMHRVRVAFPWLDEASESFWARVASPMAGNGRGAYFLPEVDDEVLVAFEHGSIDNAYVIGSLWNGKDNAPESNSDGENNNRTLKSRSGHVIRLNDKDSSESIEIIDKAGQNRITIHSSENSITVEAQSDITVTSKTGKLRMSAVEVEIESQANMKLSAGGNANLTSNGIVTVQGSLIKLN